MLKKMKGPTMATQAPPDSAQGNAAQQRPLDISGHLRARIPTFIHSEALMDLESISEAGTSRQPPDCEQQATRVFQAVGGCDRVGSKT